MNGPDFLVSSPCPSPGRKGSGLLSHVPSMAMKRQYGKVKTENGNEALADCDAVPLAGWLERALVNLYEHNC